MAKSRKFPSSIRTRPSRSQPSWEHLGLDGALQIVQTRPLMFWGGVWASILLVMLIATVSLLSPSSSSGRRVSGAATGSSLNQTQAMQENQQKGQLPLWLFGAIALTCTAGSILVSRQLTPSDQHQRRPRKLRRRVKPPVSQQPATAQSPIVQPIPSQLTATQQPIHRPPVQKVGGQRVRKTPKPYLPTEFAVPAVSSPLPPRRRSASAPSSPQKSKPVKPGKKGNKSAGRPARQEAVRVPVTIVPAEEHHPLDWKDDSLADLLDIRKRRSLSSWM